MKNKKLPIEIFFTFVFLAVSIFFIRKTDLRIAPDLSIHMKASRNDTIRLYIEKEKPLIDKVHKYFSPVSFLLSGQGIKNIRLMLGEKRGTFVIDRVTIKIPFESRHWSGKVAGEVFDLSGAKLRKNIHIKDDSLYIRSRSGRLILPLQKNISSIIMGVRKNKTVFYLIALLLSPAFFYFIHFFSLQNLKIFFTVKVALNMALIFLLIIFFPLVNDQFNITKDVPFHHLQEKRVKARMPDFRFDALFQFLKNYRYYYNDNFHLRSMLIPVNHYFKVKAFGISPVPSVMIGKKGWLYLAKQNERVDEIEYFRSIRLFTPRELEYWRISLEQRRDWLARRGIHYLFIVVPNKSTIYPEFLPDAVRPVNQQSRLDQLIAYLKTHSDFSILDLRPVLLAAKQERRVYRKTDSHWNRYGAYIAYREIIKALSVFYKEARPADISGFKMYIKEQGGGDLAIMLSLQNNIYRDRVIEMKHLKSQAAKEGKHVKKNYAWVKQSVKENPRGELPTTLMVHDSFLNRMKSFFSEHFSKIIYLRDWGVNFYADIIKTEKPALVIDEMAERFLMDKMLSRPPEE